MWLGASVLFGGPTSCWWPRRQGPEKGEAALRTRLWRPSRWESQPAFVPDSVWGWGVHPSLHHSWWGRCCFQALLKNSSAGHPGSGGVALAPVNRHERQHLTRPWMLRPLQNREWEEILHMGLWAEPTSAPESAHGEVFPELPLTGHCPLPIGVPVPAPFFAGDGGPPWEPATALVDKKGETGNERQVLEGEHRAQESADWPHFRGGDTEAQRVSVTHSRTWNLKCPKQLFWHEAWPHFTPTLQGLSDHESPLRDDCPRSTLEKRLRTALARLLSWPCGGLAALKGPFPSYSLPFATDLTLSPWLSSMGLNRVWVEACHVHSCMPGFFQSMCCLWDAPMSLRVHEVCSFLLLSVFHSAGVVTAYLSPVERHRDHSQFLADIMTFFFFGGYMYPLRYIPRCGMAGLNVNVYLISVCTARRYSKVVLPFHLLSGRMWELPCFHITHACHGWPFHS